jgi:hypothetical protein
MRRADVTFEFVELMPPLLEDGVIYISMTFATASHLCMCGCGEKVVTPFSPTDWKLTFDGISISISPSIGNWDYKCRSHYWISNNRVHWAPPWTHEQVMAAREREGKEKDFYYGELPEPKPVTPPGTAFFSRLLRFFGRGK